MVPTECLVKYFLKILLINKKRIKKVGSIVIMEYTFSRKVGTDHEIVVCLIIGF